MGGTPAAGLRPRRRRGPAGEPLPLPVDASAGAPAPPRLEMPVPCASAFDAGGWRFSVDWDGIRAVLSVNSGGGARLSDERLRDLGGLLPELAAAASAPGTPLAGRGAVLDGVATVLDGRGRPDLGALSAALARRSLGRPGAGGARLALVVTDLLELGGTPLGREPLAQRRARLAELLPEPLGPIVVADDVETEGHAFAAAAAKAGLSAVLARRDDAPYAAGVASPDRLRVALEARSDAVVVGAVGEGAGCRLLLAEMVDRELRWSGRVALAAPPEVVSWFASMRPGLAGAGPAAAGIPPVDGGVEWLRPHLVATVIHRGREPGGALASPRLVALRDDRDPAWCCRRAPVAPPCDERRASSFRPMVLRRLPLD